MSESGYRYTASDLASPLISDELMEQLQAVGRPLHFGPGEVIYLQDSYSSGVYCIVHGRVKVIQLLEDGTEVILNILSDGRSFGEVSALDRAGASPTAIAITNVECILIPAGQICQLIRSNPDFAIYITYCLVHKVRSSACQLRFIAGKRVRSRLAATLLMLRTYSIPVDSDSWFSITHAELASLISATRSNVSVLLGDFSRLGLIETGRNRLRILSPDGLSSIAAEE